MVRTDSFVGKRKVKDRWEDGGFIVESQLGDWPVYKVRCPSADDRQKPKYRILHRNRLLLVADEDVDDASGHAQAKATPTLPNATHEALSVRVGSQESLPSLVTRQGGELTSMVWLNGEFRTKPWTQVVSRATPSLRTCMWMRSLVMSRQNQRGRSPMVTWALGSTVYETS